MEYIKNLDFWILVLIAINYVGALISIKSVSNDKIWEEAIFILMKNKSEKEQENIWKQRNIIRHLYCIMNIIPGFALFQIISGIFISKKL